MQSHTPYSGIPGGVRVRVRVRVEPLVNRSYSLIYNLVTIICYTLC